MSERSPEIDQTFGPCVVDEHGRCVTCYDEALPGRVLSVDDALGIATVVLPDSTAEVDISLLDAVAPGDVLLIHGGVALETLRELAR